MPIYDDIDEKELTKGCIVSGFYCDHWDKLAETENFLFVFDHLPKQMRLMVDFRIEGKTNEEIAKMMEVTEDHVSKTLRIAAKRFISANRDPI